MRSTNSPKSQRVKTFAIVVLAIVLVAAIGSNFMGSDETIDAAADQANQAAVSLASLPQAAIANSPLTPATANQSAGAPLEIPEIAVKRVILRNPFRRKPDWQATGENDQKAPSSAAALIFAENVHDAQADEGSSTAVTDPSADAIGNPVNVAAEKVIEPPSIPVAAIVTGNGRPAALIGDKLYRENDLVEGRWRIASIDARGLVVMPVTPPE
jgi:hypothetical protein